MLRELEEMSVGQKLYDYECKLYEFEKDAPEFIILRVICIKTYV